METRLFSGANRNLLVLAIVLCVGLFSISRDVSAGQGSLDGKTFVVETGEKGKSGGGQGYADLQGRQLPFDGL